MVRDSYAIERRDYFAAAIGERGHHLGHGLRNDWAALPEGRCCPGKMHNYRQLCLAPTLHLRFPRDDCECKKRPRPVAQSLDEVHLLKAFHECFRGADQEVNYVDFEIEHNEADTERRTRVRRGGVVARESKFTPIQRS